MKKLMAIKSFVACVALVCGVVSSALADGTFVSYIEATGYQYINTLYNHKAGDKFECVIQLSSSQPHRTGLNYPTLFGAKWNNASSGYVLHVEDCEVSNKSLYQRNGKAGFDVTMPKLEDIWIVCDKKVALWTNRVDGTTGRAVDGKGYGGDSSIPMLIFQNNYAGSVGGVNVHDNWWCNAKLRSFRITTEEGVVVREFVPYRTAEGRYGLWDVAANDDPDYVRFYPSATETELIGGGAAFDLVDGAVTVGGGTLAAGDFQFAHESVEKIGSNVLHAGALVSCADLKVAEGEFALDDGVTRALSCKKLTLCGGTRLTMDVINQSGDIIANETIDLSSASAANKIQIGIKVGGDVGGSYTLIEKGLVEGDEEKFELDQTGVVGSLEVVDGALVLNAGKQTAPSKAIWTNAGGDGALDNPANWTCLDKDGGEMEGALPAASTEVQILGETAFNCPAGSSLICYTITLSNCKLTDDCDWRGLPVMFNGIVDLNGHKLYISRTEGINVPDYSGAQNGELHIDVPAGDEVDTIKFALGGSLKLVKDGAGLLRLSRSGQTYTGGTEVVGGTVGLFKQGVERVYGAPGSTVTVRSGATFDLRGFSNHYEYYFVLDGGTIANSKNQGYETHAWLKNVTLTADSYFSAPSGACFGLVANGYSEVTLNMNGHTLYSDNDGYFFLVNLTVNGGGKIVFRKGGWAYLGGNTVGANMFVHADDTTFEFVSGNVAANIHSLGDDIRVGTYVSNYTRGWNDGEHAIKVLHRFAPYSDQWHSVELQNGATLDLSGKTAPLGLTCSFPNGTCLTGRLTFAENATIMVDFGEGGPCGRKVIAWDADTAPAASVKFVSPGIPLQKKDDGLYRGGTFMLLIR